MTPTSLLTAAGALAAVIAAISLIGRLARSSPFLQRHTHRAAARLALIETLSLDPKRRLLLVQCDGRHLLLLAGQQDQVVGWLPEQSA